MVRVKMLWILILVAILSFPNGLAFSTKNQSTLTKHIITVDDEPGDADYTSIADALNHSSPGDTIEVFSGTYYDHGMSIMNDGITLIGVPHELGNGSDTGKPFINGQGLSDVIDIRSKNVTVTDFHIENKGNNNYNQYIITMISDANNCTVSNNTFIFSGNSIVYCSSSNNKIVNNIIRDASLYCGIVIAYPGYYNTASGNTIDKCPEGIRVFGSKYNTIVGNLITYSNRFGVDVAGGRENLFQYNIFENNSEGFNIYQTAFNNIKENNFLHNSQSASFDSVNLWWTNRWLHNYWDRPRLLPYPIQGSNFIFHWVQFDWHPALVPNKMPTRAS